MVEAGRRHVGSNRADVIGKMARYISYCSRAAEAGAVQTITWQFRTRIVHRRRTVLLKLY